MPYPWVSLGTPVLSKGLICLYKQYFVINLNRLARALARKSILLTFSRNWKIRLVFQRSPPWLVSRIFFLVQSVERWNCHPEKDIFQSITLYSTNKLPLRNVFLFFYHKLSWDHWNRNKQTLILFRESDVSTTRHLFINQFSV